jgi:hypothetical protein
MNSRRIAWWLSLFVIFSRSCIFIVLTAVASSVWTINRVWCDANRPYVVSVSAPYPQMSKSNTYVRRARD